MADPFIPTLCRAEVSPDQRYVRITFERDVGASFDLLVPASQFPTIAASSQTQTDQLAPGTAGHRRRPSCYPAARSGRDA